MKKKCSLLLLTFVFYLFFQTISLVAYASDSHTKVEHIISQLRSVTCENERLVDCQSQPSAALRDYIKEQVSQGVPEKKILSKVVEMYGQEILLAPPKSGFNFVFLWLLPFWLIFVVGAFLFYRLHSTNKKSKAKPKKKLSSSYLKLAQLETERLKEEL